MPEIPRRTSQTLGHRASSYIMGTVRRNRRPVRNKKESQLPKAQKREDGATPCRRGAGPAGQRRRLAGGRAARPGGRPAARPKPTACTRGRRHPRGLREMRVGASEGRGGRGGGGGGNRIKRTGGSPIDQSISAALGPSPGTLYLCSRNIGHEIQLGALERYNNRLQFPQEPYAGGSV